MQQQQQHYISGKTIGHGGVGFHEALWCLHHHHHHHQHRSSTTLPVKQLATEAWAFMKHYGVYTTTTTATAAAQHCR
jgi:hypothetical protein